MKTVRVGMIGAGGIAPVQCRGIRKHPQGEVVAVADKSAERAQGVADDFGIEHVFTDYKKLIALDEVDAVSIALPNSLHAPVAIAALEAGKHVMLEKPFALSAAEAQKVIDASRKARKVCMVGMNQRFKDSAQAIKAIADRGDLGDIYHARAYWLRRAGIPRFGTWFSRKKLAGGGALLDIGVHALDLALYLMGNFRPLTVSGVVYSQFGPRGLGEGGWGKSDRGKHVFDVDDMAGALIRLRGGASVQLEVSWARHQPAGNFNDVELYGTEAMASVYPARVSRPGKVEGEYEVVEPQNVKLAHPHCDRMVHWIDVILKNEKSICTLKQALTVQKILDAIYESAKTRREVRF